MNQALARRLAKQPASDLLSEVLSGTVGTTLSEVSRSDFCPVPSRPVPYQPYYRPTRPDPFATPGLPSRNSISNSLTYGARARVTNGLEPAA